MPARPARSIAAVCLSLVLLGLAAGLYKLRVPPGPVGEEATQVLMAASLWHERDLAFDHRDLLRAYRIWDHGPAGLALRSADGGRSMRYGEPFLYALAALPFYGVLGPQGLLVFNMALWLAMLAAARALWRGGEAGAENGAAGLFLAGGFFASASFAYVFRLEPEAFAMAGAFLPLAAWLHLRRRPAWRDRDLWLLAGAGALLAAAALVRPPVALLALPVVVDLARLRRWPGLAVLAAGALVCLAAASAVERRLEGGWPWAPAGVRRTFFDEFPVESQRALWAAESPAVPAMPTTSAPQATPAPPPLPAPPPIIAAREEAGPDLATGLRLLPRNLVYFFIGRHAGLVPYFPFAFLALALYLAGPRDLRDGPRTLLALAVGVATLLLLVRHPGDWHGGADALGNARFAVLYPVLLLLPVRIPWPRALLIPFAIAGLWTAPAVIQAVDPRAPDPGAATHVRAPAFRALPLELTLLHRLPGNAMRAWGEAVWVVPRETFSTEEAHPNGVWVRGASRSELVVVAPRPLAELTLRAWSLSGDNEMILASGAERLRVRFDTEGKRGGTPLTLKLGRPARLGFPPGGPVEYLYTLDLETTDGLIPARRVAGNRDPRYLGVFLDFTGGGP